MHSTIPYALLCFNFDIMVLLLAAATNVIAQECSRTHFEMPFILMGECSL